MAVPAVGDVFAGKYAIEALVGRGGMGIVLAARHLELDERVAIKLIVSEDGPKNADFVARFVREAKLASKIKSEHVVRVLDVARLETGEPYIVMELLEGQDLSELLNQRGPLSVDQAALFLLQVCEALAEAHAFGIVHRDLKPANLFLTTRRDGQPCVKVLDFGISKLVAGGTGPEPAMTRTNALMGSPMYMSPDQLIQSKDVDARSDIWALGVILFELLTKRCPFEGLDAPAVITQILYGAHTPLASVRSDAPPELSALVDATLAKDRTQRIQDVAEFARRLAPFAPEEGRFSVSRIAGVLGQSRVTPPSVAASSDPRTVTTGAPVRQRVGTTAGAALDPAVAGPEGRRTVLLATLVVLVVAGIGGLIFARSNRDAAVAPSPTPQAAAAEPERLAEPPVPPVATNPDPSALPAVAVAPVESPVPAPSSRTPAPAARAPAREPKKRPQAGAGHPAAAEDPFGGVR